MRLYKPVEKSKKKEKQAIHTPILNKYKIPEVGLEEPVKWYKGFKEQVNVVLKITCEFENEKKQLLVMGSADKTIKIIDLKTYKTTLAIINFPDEINHICVNPNKKYSNLLYVASSNHVYIFDFTTKDMILNCLNKEHTINDFALYDEEINKMSINAHGTLMALVNDSGLVFIIDLKNGNIVSDFKNVHTTVAMAVMFHPSKNEVISGGMDYMIKFWKTKNEFPYYEIKPEKQSISANPNQFINPPFILCSCFHKSLDIVAFGLGDGSINLMRYQKEVNCKPNWKLFSLPFDHNYSVSFVQFININNQHFLLSAGNDGIIKLILLDLKKFIDHKLIFVRDMLPFSKINSVGIINLNSSQSSICLSLALAGVVPKINNPGVAFYELNFNVE